MELLFKACIHTSLKENQWGERCNHEYTENYHNSIHVKASPVKLCLDLYKIAFIVYVLPIVCNDVIQYIMVSHAVRTKLLAQESRCVFHYDKHMYISSTLFTGRICSREDVAKNKYSATDVKADFNWLCQYKSLT